jgi:uncharacterized membrane protein
MTAMQTAPVSSQPRLYALAAFLAVAGLADSIYLTVTHLTGEDVTCVASSGCSEVLSSAYASVGSIPLGAFGVLGYFIAFSLATLASFGYSRALVLLRVIVAGMLATTLWLLYVQAFVLHAFCDFCLLSAGLTLSLSTIAVIGYFIERKHRVAGEHAPTLQS